FELRPFEFPRLLPSVDHAVNDGQVGQYSNDPKHRRHAVEQRAENDEYDPLRTLQKAHLAAGDRVLGSRPRVADHHRAGHYDRRENNVEEPVDTGVIHKQTHEKGEIGIPVENRVEEAAEPGHAIAFPGDRTIDQVEEPGADHHQPGGHESAARKLPGGGDVGDKAQKSKEIGIDAGECERADNAVQNVTAGDADGAGIRYGHARLPLIVNSRQAENLKFFTARRRTDLYYIAHPLAQQTPSDR